MAVPVTFREKLAFYFDDFETTTGQVINLLITSLILLSCGLFVAETYVLEPIVRQWVSWIDNVIFVLFTIEYLLRLWSAPDRAAHFLRLSSLIDLVVLLPFLIATSTIGFLRIFRWLRVLRLIRFFDQRTLFGYFDREDSAIAAQILFTIFAIIFVYAGLIYQVEHRVNGAQFGTFLDAVYYAVSSISTAGFGDINPTTQVGRLLSILMMLTGLVLIPWQLGDLVKRFVKNRDHTRISCARCGLQFHDQDARYCKACGTALPDLSVAAHQLAALHESALSDRT
ncbi:MAG: ion transporter [Alkalinema sp. RL_2_19]|nr:ion transporter [Alkalinema sp. RL_2_19]